jgi:hypothetical protein
MMNPITGKQADSVMAADEHLMCIGCKASVPISDGSSHAYLGASPGCFAIYGEVLAREYTDYRYAAVHNLTVDAYSLQHPGQPEPRTIRSTAIHLISLYWQLEHGYDNQQAAYIKQQAANRDAKLHYVWLEPPATPGKLTILDVHKAQSADSHIQVVSAWAKCVWETWREHHPTVHQWLNIIQNKR